MGKAHCHLIWHYDGDWNRKHKETSVAKAEIWRHPITKSSLGETPFLKSMYPSTEGNLGVVLQGA